MSHHHRTLLFKIFPKAYLPAVMTGILLLSGICSSLQAEDLKALIVTGQNSHNWQKSSKALEQILETDGLFQADISISPAGGKDMGSFQPDFKAYDCIVLDYQGDPWPQKTRDSFVDYVRTGGGVVVYHNSSNSFTDWMEYSSIIGLGGHRGREIGPYIYWEDGRLVRDSGPGISLYHGPIHPFPVMTRTLDHPITKGLPLEWMHAADELYCLLRGPAENLTILATAYADPEMEGTGRHEPVLFTNTFGQGRIFHTALGHMREDPAAMECVGFIATLRRGAEWAATGNVTQEIPGDFPESSLGFPTQIRRWKNFQPPSLDAILKKMSVLTRMEQSEVPAELRDYILSHKKSLSDRTASERKLSAFLAGPASPESKAVVCRHLRLIGSESSVPDLARLLTDPELSDPARYALEKIPGVEADQALLAALVRSPTPNRLGIISTLGRRKTSFAVNALFALAGGPDRPSAEASILALGRIGSPAAADALKNLMERDSQLSHLSAAGIVNCAESMGTSGLSSEAADLSRYLIISGAPVAIRQAALRNLIRNSLKKSSVILEFLKGGDTDLFLPAIDMVPSALSSASDTEPFCLILPSLPEKARIQLLAALGPYSTEGVRKAAEEAAGHGPEPVSIEALKVLAACGSKESIPVLLQKAAVRGQVQEAARFALNNMKGADIDKALVLHVIKSADPDIQVEALRAMGERGAAIGIPVMLSRSRSADPAVRSTSLRALRELADPEHIPSLLDLLLEAKSDRDRAEISRAVGAAASKLPPDSHRARLVIERYNSIQDTKGRAVLLSLLGQIGENRSLPLLRNSLKEGEADLNDAAVRALAGWPNPAPRFDLFELAETAENITHRILALRAFIRMIEMEPHQSPQGAVLALQEALRLSTQPEEKKLVLGVLPVFSCKEALQLAESLAGEEDIKAEAETAAGKIKKALEKQS